MTIPGAKIYCETDEGIKEIGHHRICDRSHFTIDRRWYIYYKMSIRILQKTTKNQYEELLNFLVKKQIILADEAVGGKIKIEIMWRVCSRSEFNWIWGSKSRRTMEKGEHIHRNIKDKKPK